MSTLKNLRALVGRLGPEFMVALKARKAGPHKDKRPRLLEKAERND